MWEKLYYKQSTKVISYQKELTEKEQELVMLRKKTTILQYELGQHYDMITAEKAEKERMICELNSRQKMINKLQENIKIHEADIKQLNQQLQHQISSESQINEREILIKEMQEMRDKLCTTEMKLSELYNQVKDQHETICNKDKYIQTLQNEIENDKVGIHDNKTMAIRQLNVENKTLKSTVKKEIKTTTIINTHSKVAGFIRKKFLLEKKFPSK